VGAQGQRRKEVGRGEGGCETRSTLSPSSAFSLGLLLRAVGGLADWQVSRWAVHITADGYGRIVARTLDVLLAMAMAMAMSPPVD
jgi:hypothetical protein